MFVPAFTLVSEPSAAGTATVPPLFDSVIEFPEMLKVCNSLVLLKSPVFAKVIVPPNGTVPPPLNPAPELTVTELLVKSTLVTVPSVIWLLPMVLLPMVVANDPVPLPVTGPVNVIVWSPVFVPLIFEPVTVPVAATEVGVMAQAQGYCRCCGGSCHGACNAIV